MLSLRRRHLARLNNVCTVMKMMVIMRVPVRLDLPIPPNNAQAGNAHAAPVS